MKKQYFLFLLAILMCYSASAQLIINEVLYDPPAGLAGDANGDGVRSATEDEFIEFINNSATSLDVSGYMIYDFVIADGTRTLRHTIPGGTVIPANGVLVVFGGGMPTGTFGGAIVVADIGTAGLSLGNSGELIQIEDASGTQILEFDSDALSNNPDESYTRDPDITGAFVQHAQDTDASITALFSPGTKIDGTSILSVNDVTVNSFNIYPNPVSDGFVTIKSTTGQAINVVMVNLLGKEVRTVSLVNNQLLDVSDLKSGIYILRITQNNATICKKLIVK